MASIIKKQYYWGYLVILLCLLATLAIYFGSMWYYDDWYDYKLKYLAKIGSMSATILMCWAFLLATRFRFIENLFGGLDKAYKVHRWVGESAFFLIFLHPIFLALDPKYHFFSYFWIDYLPEEELHYYVARMSGISALLIFILLVAFSLWIPMRYHRWKQTHNFFGLLLLLVVFHGIAAQGEIMSYPFLLGWFGLWVTMGLLGFLYIRLLYRWFGPLHDYIVHHVEQLGDITEIYLQSRRPYRRLLHRPGQFIYIYFDSPELSSEPHPFSISSEPQSDYLRISIKDLGDWTGRMKQLEKGEHAYVWGPYGKFSDHYFEHADKEAVLIGGGIGITPFLSIVKDKIFQSGERNEVYLFYSYEKKGEDYYREEVEQVDADTDHFSSILHCADKKGYLSAEIIKEKVGGDLSNKVFLICGPKPMMDALQKQLLEAGVSFEHIFKEDFSVI
jgi:predicted ferric reductase